MFAVSATSFDAENPLNGLTLGEVADPEVPEGWVVVTLRAAALNHHDLWSLKGVGLRAEQLPMILGCDGAGVDADGNEVIIHAVIADPDAGDGDETLDLASVAFIGTLSGNACSQDCGAAPQSHPETVFVVVRRSSVLAHLVVDRLSHALHPCLTSAR